MIKSKFYDVEILKNFFSITIIDITSYLEVMKDACDEKGNPIPLVQKFTVKEIKERLDTVKSENYYITDTDDSQLFPMLKAINDMRPHYEKIVMMKIFLLQLICLVIITASMINSWLLLCLCTIIMLMVLKSLLKYYMKLHRKLFKVKTKIVHLIRMILYERFE